MTQQPPRYAGAITDIQGIEVGHHILSSRPTGCSVVIAREGAVGGVDVRGAAPGTRETDLLHPTNLVNQVHAVVLSGGSAWGLDTASGVMRWLAEHNIGLRVGASTGELVPIVPAAVLFDLHIGDARIRPGAEAGYLACTAASAQLTAQGNIGVGAGATVGKLFGLERAMKGGVGSASVSAYGIKVGALIAVNALGDVVDLATSQPIAGARRRDDLAQRADSVQAVMTGEAPMTLLAGINTTIGVIATDAQITKSQAQRLAGIGHDGLARAIRPAHTMNDGDTLFALGTGRVSTFDFNVVCLLAAEAVGRACVNAVWAAQTIHTNGLVLPAAHDLQI